jgi:hypothetical protein
MSTFPVSTATDLLHAIDLLADVRSMRDRAAVKVQSPMATLFDSMMTAIAPALAGLTPVITPGTAVISGATPVVAPVIRSGKPIQWPPFIEALDDRLRKNLSAVLAKPCEATWDVAHCIVVNEGESSGGVPRIESRRTLWQMVLTIDPAFPKSKPAGEPWPQIPTTDILRRAMGITEPVEKVAVSTYEPAVHKIEAAALAVTAGINVGPKSPMRDVVFEPYYPQRLRIEGAQQHPTPLVESAAMASVMPPMPTYSPCLPREVIEHGLLSIAQLEAIVYAGQAFREYLEPQLVRYPMLMPPKITREMKVGDGRYRRWLSDERFIDEALVPSTRVDGKVFSVHRADCAYPILTDAKWITESTHDTLEQAITAVSSHEKIVKFRKGWYLADSTGVGKGRSISGCILDTFARGQTKAIWISKTPKLVKDAIRDWTDLGGSKDEIIPLARIGANEKILATRGILFVTYGTLKSAAKDNGDDKPGQTRLQQIIDWVGEDFDGVICFDEAHVLRNSISVKGSRGSTEPSQAAIAGCDLQDQLPEGRVLYSSATGAEHVSNLAYCSRLGLWGRGTPFPTKRDFIQQIEGGGVAAMELVARDLKARGLYLARGLSFGPSVEGGPPVEYERLVHVLSEDQCAIYDRLCDAWQVCFANINEALQITAMSGNGKVDGKAKGAAYSAFFGSQQRFYNQILTAMQMPSVLADIQKQLDAGNCCVLQLVNTQEAMMERQLAKLDEEDDLSDIDMTPRDMLLQMVEHSFPVTQKESYHDGDKWKMRPVVDSAGNLVLNKTAVAMRDKLLMDLATISCPDGPMEMLLNHFGVDNVAEVTGRGRRVVRKMVDSIEQTVIEQRSATKCSAEAAQFQDGKRQIIVFSDAGGTGTSYHSSMAVRNQKRRTHYLVQAGWIALQAIQGFGRTHRSGQVVPPLYKLVATTVKGHARFISSIAKRLDQLGALTRGQRQAVGQGLFTAADNLEGEYARAALYRLFKDLHGGTVEGISLECFMSQTGLNIIDDEGNLKKDLPPVSQFLNRLLAMHLVDQNNLFQAFDDRIKSNVQAALLAGTFEKGVETIICDSAKKLSESVVYTDVASGAETRHVHLSLRFENHPFSFEDVISSGESTHFQKVEFFAVNELSHKLWAFCQAGSRTLANGSVVDHFWQVGPLSRHAITKGEVVGRGTHWRRVGNDLAQTMWDQAVAALPTHSTEDLHLITGAILPIWDRLKGSPRVKRVATDEGERLLGRVIPDDELMDTMARLGVNAGAAQYPVHEVVNRLMAGTHRFVLANGWVLKRSRTVDHSRATVYKVELTGDGSINGPGISHMSDLKQDWLYFERGPDFRGHFYLPVTAGVERMNEVVKAIIKSRPIVKSVKVAGVA